MEPEEKDKEGIISSLLIVDLKSLCVAFDYPFLKFASVSLSFILTEVNYIFPIITCLLKTIFSESPTDESLELIELFRSGIGPC